MVTLATSTVTVALIAAGAALLGGVFGAIAGGLADYFLERRREKAKARAGARLLRSDLRVVAGRCRTAAELKAWLRPWGPVIEATWDEYRDILAASLDTDRWTTVEKAVSLTRQIESIVAKAERAESPVVALVRGRTEAPLAPEAVESLTRIGAEARRAFDALADLAKGPVADDTFGTPIRDQPPALQ
jgi:hypothetical protein